MKLVARSVPADAFQAVGPEECRDSLSALSLFSPQWQQGAHTLLTCAAHLYNWLSLSVFVLEFPTSIILAPVAVADVRPSDSAPGSSSDSAPQLIEF